MCPVCFSTIKTTKSLELIFPHLNSLALTVNICFIFLFFLCVFFLLQTLPLISQSRRMVREGPVTQLMDFSLKETEKNAYLHLFNDYLVLSLPKE